MILRYAANLKLAKELYDASKPKLKGDQGMKETFTNVFGLPENAVKLAGTLEATAAALFAASFLSKNLSRLGSITTFGVLGVAAYKHFEAGHGKEGAQHALDLLGLAALSFADTFCEKK
ncbi:Uncharacterised protein [Staphylococcus petrasii]|uniref:DoxX family protein n=1 Tax=Staphylococcus petrasii TaxID=1276936 RepID=A0A380FVF2_9STAP|nr:hypothetical protein [Staphylococcus petrasii]MCI2774188.1 hypothetical protein [Staphylococcus petrasii]PNZ30788.1 hypothetical protein CD137_03730 [Staphylococcus petrasii]TGE10842.1 hypothetical protein E2557_12295 [Staphylococcus petrasii]TGE16632.1 hypothetical protein BJR09_08660 [Staphylococcus petrasii]SUM42794.1 Uncharacterised protein [Staphylococcus petrasii]